MFLSLPRTKIQDFVRTKMLFNVLSWEANQRLILYKFACVSGIKQGNIVPQNFIKLRLSQYRSKRNFHFTYQNVCSHLQVFFLVSFYNHFRKNKIVHTRFSRLCRHFFNGRCVSGPWLKIQNKIAIHYNDLNRTKCR
jgi:hypothetical protein